MLCRTDGYLQNIYLNLIRISVCPLLQKRPKRAENLKMLQGWFSKLRASSAKIFAHSYLVLLLKNETYRAIAAVIAFNAVVAVVLVTGLVWETSRHSHDPRLQACVHVGAAVVVGLLMLRQFYTILQNKDLTKQLRDMGENLEEVVRQRTKELGVKTDQLIALQTLTSAINETLDSSNVLMSAVTQTCSMFDAAAVAIWLCDGTSTKINPTPKSYVGLPEESKAFKKAAAYKVHDHSSKHAFTVKESGSTTETFQLLQAPLNSHGVFLGKIGILQMSKGFTESDVQIFDSISLHVGTALDNAKQYWRARDAADRDPVTGLLNHRAILEYLDTAIDLQSAFEEPLAVILGDIDNFHMFNDTYGHPVGDEVLRKIGEVLESSVTAPNKVGRYRGDEYILVLPGASADQAFERAKEMQQKIAELELRYDGDERIIPTSVSFGIASFPTDSTERQDLLTTAGNNLNSAKNTDAHIVALTEMQRAHRELRVSSSFKMLDSMVTAVDNKDRYTRKHSEDVTEFALWMAESLGYSDEDKQSLRTGGLLHDVGKIGVPDEILRKPGRLDEEEYTVMKQHPTLGALIVGGISGMENIIDIVKHHHEHYNGAGYPDGLVGEDIPFNARLVAIADAMSAMTTDRPYRKGMSIQVALSRIKEAIGTQFDPQLADIFIRVAKERLNIDDDVQPTAEPFQKAA
jgi:diguanylate cyclase (GGDEF)-like protein/putative nucleotidyltransferase with HDIG domain